jgi:3',5'-cyclic AMP phosphodiesterase CpdA
MVFMHHPPFPSGITFLDQPAFDGAGDLGDLIRRHRQVRLIVCGHVHRAIHAPWAGTIAAIAPSTVYQMPLALTADADTSDTADPAAFSLYLWRDRWQPTGYIQLIMDGSGARPRAKPLTDDGNAVG